MPGVLHVPVRACAAGAMVISTGRLPSREPVGLAFSSPDRLAAVFGPGHPSIRLHPRVLRTMLAPLGIHQVLVDPKPAGTANRTTTKPSRVPPRIPPGMREPQVSQYDRTSVAG